MGQVQSDEVRIAIQQHDPVYSPEGSDSDSKLQQPIKTFYTLKAVEVNTSSLMKMFGQKIIYLRQVELKGGVVTEYRLPSFPSRDGEFRVFGGRTYLAFPESRRNVKVPTSESPTSSSAQLNYTDFAVLARAVLGQGLGPVYCCKWLGQIVALREVYCDVTENHDAILDHACLVQHPNVLRMYGYVKNGDSYYLASHYTEAVNLEQLINDPHVPWNWEMFLKIALDIADAMRCLHYHHLHHLDLNPTDILVSFRSKHETSLHAVLANFGRTESQYRAMKQIIYSALHVPEPSPSPIEYERYDVGCYGFLLQRMLTRRYDWGSLSALQRQIKFEIGERPPLPESTPKNISELINWCWSRRLEDRPSFEQISFVLERYNAELDTSPSVIDFPEPFAVVPLFSSAKICLPFGELRLVIVQLDTGIQIRLYVEGLLILTRYIDRETTMKVQRGTLSVSCDILEITNAFRAGYQTSPAVVSKDGVTATITIKSFYHHFSRKHPRIEGNVSLSYVIGKAGQKGLVEFGDASDEQNKPVEAEPSFEDYANTVLTKEAIKGFCHNAISQSMSQSEITEGLNRLLERESQLQKNGIVHPQTPKASANCDSFDESSEDDSEKKRKARKERKEKKSRRKSKHKSKCKSKSKSRSRDFSNQASDKSGSDSEESEQSHADDSGDEQKSEHGGVSQKSSTSKGLSGTKSVSAVGQGIVEIDLGDSQKTRPKFGGLRISSRETTQPIAINLREKRDLNIEAEMPNGDQVPYISSVPTNYFYAFE